MSEKEKETTGADPERLLDSRVNDHHLAEIAKDLVEWEILAPYLELTESDQKEIAEDFRGRYNLQKRQALRVWRWKSGDNATYRQLIAICHSQGLVKLAESIAAYLGCEQQLGGSQILDTFYRYLLDCYLNLPHPSTQQWPSNIMSSFPLYAPTTFLDLILYEAPLHEIQYSSETSSSSYNVKAVTLKSILRRGEKHKPMLVYLEGTAGSGKTTLSWHACREWAEKRLLKSFQLFIHVQLNDPLVQSATILADIIPYPDKEFRQEVATAMIDRKGKGICLVLDGLDEAPTELLDFLLVGLIKGRLGCPYLPELSLVMTSRPDNRVTKRLESIISSRILIKGFNRENLHKHLNNSLGDSSVENAKLVREFKINPRLEGLCSHPLNAVIMTFLIHFLEKDIPTTQTNLFKPLVSNFLIRHFQTRLNKEEPCEIDNLLDERCIPCEIREPFKKMCMLAYSSILENKRLFTKEEICQGDVDDTLGFLHAYPRITMFGTKRYYCFFHLSLQEFLAALHLSKMNECEQVVGVKWFLSKNPRSQVLSFYAGLTSLSNREALKVMSATFSQSTHSSTVLKEKLRTKFTDDPRQKSLAFLSCLFECQDKSVLTLRETEMSLDKNMQQKVTSTYTKARMLPPSNEPPYYTLTVRHLALTPLDCLALGYYIQVKSRMPESICRMIDLYNCSVDPLGIRLLFTELKKNINHCTKGIVHLILTHIKFDKDLLHPLKELLQGQSNLCKLGLRDCFNPPRVNLSYTLKCLIEGLSDNSSCGFIDLEANHFNSDHIYHFILMLRACPQLYCLYVGHFDLSKTMPLFCSALALTSLQMLDLCVCNISDSNLMLLGKTICKLSSLFHLKIYGNPFSDDGLSCFLGFFVNNPYSQLTLLDCLRKLNKDHKHILQQINWFRSRVVPPIPHLIIDSIMDGSLFFTELFSQVFLETLKKLPIKDN